jgi:hypothetical protein
LADGGSSSELLARGVLVYRGWLLPGLGPETMASGVRVDLRLERLATPQAHAVGLGKLEVLQLSGASFHWGGIGSGVATALPTATSSLFGSDDVQIGPACYAFLAAIRHVPSSLIVRTMFATGDSPAIETALEPSVAVELTDAVSLSSNGIIEIDWHAHDARVPINLHVGYAFTDHWYVEAGPQLVVAGSSRGDATIDFEVDYLGSR